MAYTNSQLNTLLETIAAIQKTITIPGGTITDAFPYPVSEASQANAPFFYNEFKGGPAKIAAITGAYELNSDIEMVLCITSFNSEMSISQVYTLVSYWRDAVLITFAKNTRLGGTLSFILDSQITKVSEYQKVTTASATEWGALTFTLRVREFFAATVTA